jgi:hypothetical protein
MSFKEFNAVARAGFWVITGLSPTACSMTLLASTEWVFVVASTTSVVAARSASMTDDSETLCAPGDAKAFPGVCAKLELYP